MVEHSGRVDTFGQYRDWKVSSSCSYMTAVIHFRPDQPLVKVDSSRRSELLTRTVEETTHVSSIFNDGSHVRVLLEVGVELRS